MARKVDESSFPIESMEKFATVNPGQMVSCTIEGATYAVIGVMTSDGVKIDKRVFR